MRIFPWMVGLTLVGCVEESDKPEQNDSTDTSTDTNSDSYFSLHTKLKLVDYSYQDINKN